MKKLRKQISKLAYSRGNSFTSVRTFSLASPHLVDPWFITGFTDAEGCFHIGFNKNSELKTA